MTLDRELAALRARYGTPTDDGRARATVDPFIDWPDFWAKDRRDAEWLLEPLLAYGRAHAFWARHKTGKSLLFLWMAVELVRRHLDVTVIYLDYEMGEDDLYERLEDMGYGPTSDLARLRYALLPTLPPLDTAAGATELLGIIDTELAARPGAHVVVLIDTTGRAVAGEENSADTIRNYHRHTGLALKARGITVGRADHAGKDDNRGQRGSSAKGDDVDVVWHVTPGDDGLILKRDAARMGWIPERVGLERRDDPLRFVVTEDAWPAGTKEVADLLDELDVPLDAGDRKAGEALRNAGHHAANTVLRAALRWRRLEHAGSIPE
jgi:hypothetical protein